MDMQGRTIKTKQLPALVSGEHIIDLSTTDLNSGNYIYSIITSTGDAIASQMMIVR